VFKRQELVMYNLKHDLQNTSKELLGMVQSWTTLKPDVCLISCDRSRIFSHRILLSLYSRSLLSVLKDYPPFELPAISVPASGKSIKNLLRLLTNGVTVSASEEDLLEVKETAIAMEIELKDWNIKSISVPKSKVLTYCRDPVVLQIQNIKPNVIDMANPSLADLSILDDEIEIVDTIINVDNKVDKEMKKVFPKTEDFTSEEFRKRVKRMKEAGTMFKKRRTSTAIVPGDYKKNLTTISEEFQFIVPKVEPISISDEFAPDVLMTESTTSSQSESSVTLAERKAPKHKLFAEDLVPKELPETPKKNRVSVEDAESMNAYPRFYCASCECGLSGLNSPRRVSVDGHNTGTPRTPKTPVQRELYNSCDLCMKKKAEDSIRSIKQKKYLQMLKENRIAGEKAKKEGIKYPCDKCDYVAVLPGNLKTHQMANHDGVQFMEQYVNDYFTKNKFLIL